VPEASKSDPAFLDAIDYVKDYFTSNIERGITFSYSRLDVSVEPEFASVFELEEGQVPGIVVLNPGKKKRFMKSDKPLTQQGLTDILDKIMGGDARFKMIKGNKLPEFTAEHAQYTQWKDSKLNEALAQTIGGVGASGFSRITAPDQEQWL